MAIDKLVNEAHMNCYSNSEDSQLNCKETITHAIALCI